MAQEITQERQSEIAHANQLQVEVMKGLQCGEPVERLLLKALEKHGAQGERHCILSGGKEKP